MALYIAFPLSRYSLSDQPSTSSLLISNHTVARICFFEAYNPQCGKFIRGPRSSNTPQIPGAMRITKSKGQHFHVRFDGTTIPLMALGLLDQMVTPLCLASARTGSIVLIAWPTLPMDSFSTPRARTSSSFPSGFPGGRCESGHQFLEM